VISGAVIGRDAELDFVEGFLDEVRGGPTGLVVSGEAGIGKTILWQVGVERARGRFARVLTGRSTQAEAAFSFAGLSELLGEGLGAAVSPGRCRGLLSATEGDPQEAFAALDGALTRLTDSRFPLERARTLLCLGTVRRQMLQKRGAREALEQALATFEELGARLWAEKTPAELARISGRRAAGDELTETEARVAELAVGGMSNKQIALALFMGVSTVEAHLSHVYRKLGVRSRAGLAGALGTLEVR
jgi:DNA-binding CsgD family transcriptional regulator